MEGERFAVADQPCLVYRAVNRADDHFRCCFIHHKDKSAGGVRGGAVRLLTLDGAVGAAIDGCRIVPAPGAHRIEALRKFGLYLAVRLRTYVQQKIAAAADNLNQRADDRIG